MCFAPLAGAAPSLNARGDIKLAPPEFSSNSHHRPRSKHVISQINFDYHKLDLHRFVARLLNHLITLCLGVVACQFSSARIRRDKALFHFALFNSRRRARAGRRGAQYKICDVAACQSQLGSIIIIIIVVHYPGVLSVCE